MPFFDKTCLVNGTLYAKIMQVGYIEGVNKIVSCSSRLNLIHMYETHIFPCIALVTATWLSEFILLQTLIKVAFKLNY